MKIRKRALTFEDVLLVPRYSEVLLKEVSLETKLTRNIPLNIPMVSAAMDTVTEYRAATPIPPRRAIAIAARYSVTVSIAAETIGMLSGILRVSFVSRLTSLGRTSL